jgi:hypothetical protein
MQAFPPLLVLGYFTLQFLSPRTPFENKFRNSRDALAPLNTWIAENTTNEGRIALMDNSPGFMTAAKVAYYNRRQYIGGPFSQLNMKHSHASFTKDRFLGVRLSDLTADRAATLLELYNINWVITTTDEGAAVFQSLESVMKPVLGLTIRERGTPPDADGDSPFAMYHRPEGEHPIRIFRVQRSSNYFLEGGGRLAVTANRIDISEATEGVVILKYHWDPALVTAPPLPIREHPVEGSPVGFIEVRNGSVRDFTIFPR